MPPEIPEQPDFFETPARAERLQLLLHLAHNAAQAIYLRGPAGAGKTRLVDALQRLADDLAVVRLDLAEPVRPIAGILQQLRLPPEAADRWPDQLLGALGERRLLVVVDSADALDDSTWQPLAPLPEHGVGLLLVGRGDGAGDWPSQYVDLPPFSPAESAAFLKAVAGGMADRITDEVAEAAHAAAAGRPGALLDALREFLESETSSIQPPAAEPRTEQREKNQATREDAAPPVGPATPPPEAPMGMGPRSGDAPPVRSSAPRGGPRPMDADKVLRPGIGNIWAWGGAGLLAVVLAAVLVFQDEINDLIAPPVDQPPLADDGDAPRDTGVDVERPVDAETPLKPAGEIPPIALPELSEAVSSEMDEGPGQASGSGIDQPTGTPPPPPNDPDAPQPAPQTAGSAKPVDDAGDDLLDAVMQDALKAQTVVADAEPPGDSDTDPDRSDPPAPVTPTPETEAPPVVALPIPEPTVQPQPVGGDDDTPAEPTPAPQTVKTDQVPAEAPIAMPDIGAGAADRTARRGAERAPAPVIERSSMQASVSRSVVPAGGGDQSGVPAPVEERRVSSSPADPKQAGRGEALTGERWLISREPGHYTLQLVGARDRAAIAKFVQIHGVSPPFAVFERQLNGAPWYSLVAGDYPDRDAAVAARARLPASLSGAGVWPRTFASIQAQR